MTVYPMGQIVKPHGAKRYATLRRPAPKPTMPHVAQSFRHVLKRLLEERQAGIGSINALALRWVAIYGGKKDDVRKQIRRHLGREGERPPMEPTEEMIGRYATVFEVPRGTFPAAVRPRRLPMSTILEQMEEFATRLEAEPEAFSDQELLAVEERFARLGEMMRQAAEAVAAQRRSRAGEA